MLDLKARAVLGDDFRGAVSFLGHTIASRPVGQERSSGHPVVPAVLGLQAGSGSVHDYDCSWPDAVRMPFRMKWANDRVLLDAMLGLPHADATVCESFVTRLAYGRIKDDRQ